MTRFTCRMSKDEKDQLKKAAEIIGCSASDLVREAAMDRVKKIQMESEGRNNGHVIAKIDLNVWKFLSFAYSSEDVKKLEGPIENVEEK